jgi:hypothetical protein
MRIPLYAGENLAKSLSSPIHPLAGKYIGKYAARIQAGPDPTGALSKKECSRKIQDFPLTAE